MLESESCRTGHHCAVGTGVQAGVSVFQKGITRKEWCPRCSMTVPHPVLHLKATPLQKPSLTTVPTCCLTPTSDGAPQGLTSVPSRWPPSPTLLCAGQLLEQVLEKAMGDPVELGAHICSDSGNSQQSVHTPVHNCQRPVTQFSADEREGSNHFRQTALQQRQHIPHQGLRRRH